MFNLAFLSLLLPALVSAHGYVSQVTIDGTVYKGNSPGSSATSSSIIRQVSSNSPVKGATNPDLNCGLSAQLAQDVGQANPGSQLEVQWSGGYTAGTPWPHNTGPVMHYMAKCSGSCSSYQSANAEWFKIAELGLEPGNQTWYQSQIQSGQPVSVTIPSTLAAGDYLLRSEIISLQNAMSEGGAEFYPSCIQLTVGGSQTGGPTSSETVTFPGGYTDTEAGILTPDIYNTPVNYTFPGPPVAAFVSDGSGSSSSGSGSGSSGSGSTPSTMSAPSSTAYGAPSTPTSVSGGGYTAPSSIPPVTPTPSISAPTGSSTGSCKRRKRTVAAESSPNFAKPQDDVKHRMHKRRFGSGHY
ncbi:glycoside hydrolase family 61 protein [Scleroderma yunnanense]